MIETTQRFAKHLLPDPMTYYAGQLTDLKGHGRNRKGLCPFHAEKTPSFQIDVETGDFHCFGCGAHGGDILDFHRERYGLSFVEAAKDLGAWNMNGSNAVRVPTPQELNAIRVRTERESHDAQRKRLQASAWTAELVNAGARSDSHPYFTRKGVAVPDTVRVLDVSEVVAILGYTPSQAKRHPFDGFHHHRPG